MGGRETTAARHLRTIGDDIALPRVAYWDKRGRMRYRAALVGYIFLRHDDGIDASTYYAAISRDHGVIGFVGGRDRDLLPCSTFDSDVERFRGMCDDAWVMRRKRERVWRPKAGETVRINIGPFVGHVGKVAWAKKNTAGIKIFLANQETIAIVRVVSISLIDPSVGLSDHNRGSAPNGVGKDRRGNGRRQKRRRWRNKSRAAVSA